MGRGWIACGLVLGLLVCGCEAVAENGHPDAFSGSADNGGGGGGGGSDVGGTGPPRPAPCPCFDNVATTPGTYCGDVARNYAVSHGCGLPDGVVESDLLSCKNGEG